MKNKLNKQDSRYNSLLQQISDIVSSARQEAYASLSQIMIKSYWEVGKKIIEFEQKGKVRADYGSNLLNNLSKDLKSALGKGYSRSNLQYMRLFYLCYRNLPDASGKLTWSHYVELLGLSDDLSREFYENLAIKDKLSVRELKRQIKSALFERIALSKDKKEVLAIARSGNKINKSNDVAIKYALGGISNNLFVSKYQLYLPDKDELEEKVRRLLEI